MFKILLLGEPEVDKSALIWRNLSNIPQADERLTIGIEFTTKTLVIDDKRYKLQLWELAGEKRFRWLLPQYCPGANAALFLYDVTRSQTLDNIGDWVNMVRQKSGDIPIQLVGILPDEMRERQVSAEEGKKIANSRNLSGYFECNPKIDENVEKVFEGITRLILADTSYNLYEDLSSYCYKCKKSFTTEEFLNHPCFTTGTVDATGVEILKLRSSKKAYKEQKSKSKSKSELDFRLGKLGRPTAAAGVNSKLQINREVQSFLEWVKDGEGLSGYISYYLQQNNPFIISELSKIYAELRQIFYEPPNPPIQPEAPVMAPQDRESYPYPIINSTFFNWSSGARWIYCSNCRRKFTQEEFFTHSCKHCQYCGKLLTQDEQLTHSCKKKPKNK